MPKNETYDKLKLKKFKLSWMTNDCTIVCIGKRRSGKSFLIRDIFYNKRTIPYGLIFSGTEASNPFFSDFVPSTIIHDSYDPEKVEALLNLQKKKLKKGRVEGFKDGKAPKNNCFVVLDDCIHNEKSWRNDETIKKLFFNGRHSNALLAITSQYCHALPPSLRNNIDYVFLFFDNNLQSRKKLYECFAGFIPNFDSFNDIFDQCTLNNECLVIRNDVKSKNLEELLFWYKAKDHGDFKACCPQLWDLHYEQYNERYDSENEQENSDVYKKMKLRGKKFKTYVVKNENEDEEEYSDE
jgi:hypothetical protein